MKPQYRRGLLALLGRAAMWSAAVVATWLPGPLAAQSADIRVFVSGAPSEGAKRIAARFIEQTGQRVLFTVATVAALQDRLAGGEKPDIVVLPAQAIDALDRSGALVAGSRVDVARVGIGLAVRDGASRPDISTVDAVRRTLLGAGSIVYPDPVGGGQTGAHIARVMTQLGIAESLKPKTTLLFAIGGGVARVADGKSDIGLFNISEILPVKGVTLVGSLPPELQNYITFSAALHVGTPSRDAALAFMRALVDAQAADVWRLGGLEPLGNTR